MLAFLKKVFKLLPNFGMKNRVRIQTNTNYLNIALMLPQVSLTLEIICVTVIVLV